MTETPDRELMKAVERVVRPVRASLARKRRMRDELMAHVTALFDEEMRLPNSKGEALSRAVRRLGDPAELTAQLQQTLPAGDVIARFVDRLWIDALHKPLLRRAGRNAAVVGLLILLAFSMAVPPFLPAVLNKGTWRLFAVFVMIGWFTLLLTSLAFVFTVLEFGLRQTVFASTRRLGFATLIGFASYLVIPATAFLACLALTGDAASSLDVATPAAGCALFAPLVLYLLAAQSADEQRYREEWGTLDVPG
jgi:ATP-dependent Clp protease ATP-binding subunit ClpC